MTLWGSFIAGFGFTIGVIVAVVSFTVAVSLTLGFKTFWIEFAKSFRNSANKSSGNRGNDARGL